MQNQIQTIPEGLSALAAGRDVLPTGETAFALNLKNQTLRKWSAFGNGPIRPIRIGSRLGWKVADIARLLNGQG